MNKVKRFSIIALLFSFLLIIGMGINSIKVEAETKPFVINKVIGNYGTHSTNGSAFNVQLKVKQSSVNPNVYVIYGEEGAALKANMTMDFTLSKKPDKLEVKDCIGTTATFNLNVTEIDPEKLTYQLASAAPSLYGSNRVDLYLTYGEDVEQYTFIVCGGEYYNNDRFDIFMKDTTNQIALGTDETWFQKTKNTFTKELKLSSDIKEVAVQIMRDGLLDENVTWSNIRNLPWLQSQANKVRMNGGEWQYFSGSDDKKGEFWSPDLQLKKGLNILEVQAESWKGVIDDKGIGTLGYDRRTSYIYLIEWDGEESEGIKSSDTSLNYISVIQYGRGPKSVPLKEYKVAQDENGDYYIALPEQMPVYNKTTYDKIFFGVNPTDANATVSVDSKVLLGNKAGIYQIVKVTDAEGKNLDSFDVTVTAEDGSQKVYPIKLKHVSSDCSIKSLEVNGGSLSDIDTGENLTYSEDKKVYCLSSDDKKLKLKMDVDKNAVVKFNDEVITAGEDGVYSCDLKDMVNVLKIVAADGINNNSVYFVEKKKDGTLPLFGQTKKNIELAKSMLDTGWTKRSNDEIRNMTNTYWDVFMSYASNLSFKDAVVYNIDTHKFNQATDWAACILEAIIIGENPYDYGTEHINLVEGLEKSKVGPNSYGAYANNHWAFMALKALGENMETDQKPLLNTMISLAYTVNDYKDTRAWAMAAVADYLTKEQMVELAVSLKENRNATGIWGNEFTDGCQFTAIAGMNINIDYYDIKQEDGSYINILEKYKKEKITEDGKFTAQGLAPRYVKDVIIGLGDIVNQSSAWANLRLTNAKLKTLLTQSEEVLKQDNLDETAKAALQTAYDAAKACESDEYGFGPQYYALRKALINASEKYNDHIRVCSWEDSQNIDIAISATASIGEVSISSEELLNKARTAYDSISTDKAKAYVTNYAVLTDAEAKYDKLFKEYIASLDEKIANLGDVDDLTLKDQAAVKEVKELYDALSDSQKKSLENGKTVQKAVNKMAALEVEALIEVIPEDVTLKNEKEIQVARKAYSELTTTQKRLVLSETYVKLTDAEKALKALKKPVVTIKLNKTSLTLKQNQKVTLKATVSSKEDVFWTSSNPKVASVDNSGVVTSYKDGTTVIKAFTKNGDKATCTVKVNAKLQLKASANKLTWKKIADAKGYKVYQYNSTTKKYKKIATLSASKTSYTVNKLNAGTNYTFKVTSYKVENGKDVTKKSEVVKTATKPAKVTINKVAKKSAKSIKITWKKTKATGYEVWMKSSKNGAYKLVKTITKSTTTSYTKSNLTKNKTYSFKIRAYKSVDNQKLYGSYSSVKSLKLQ